MSLNVPSFLRRDGIDTKKPFSPSITLRSRTIKIFSKTMVAYAFNLPPSLAGYTFISVIFMVVAFITNHHTHLTVKLLYEHRNCLSIKFSQSHEALLIAQMDCSLFLRALQ